MQRAGFLEHVVVGTKAKLGMPILGKSQGKGYGIGRIHSRKNLQDLARLLRSYGFLAEGQSELA
jgi:hypothetical protein